MTVESELIGHGSESIENTALLTRRRRMTAFLLPSSFLSQYSQRTLTWPGSASAKFKLHQLTRDRAAGSREPEP